MSQKPLQILFSENPFKKRIVMQKSNNNAPIVEQNLIIHHKRNLRKSLFHNSKKDFDKEQKQKEPKGNIDNKTNANNKNIKHGDIIINTGKKLIKRPNNLLMRKEDLMDEKERKEYEEKKKNDEECKKRDEPFNPFGVVVKDFLKKNQEKPESNNNTNSLNPFKNINYEPGEIINNPFKLPSQDKINKSNPFMNLAQKNENSIDKTTDLNPFKNVQSNLNNLNPFIQNKKDNKIQNHTFISDNNNPFLNIITNKTNNNPFLDINDKTNNNPFLNNNNKTNNNPFLNGNNEKNNDQTKNPFLIKDSSNVFTFDSNNLIHDSDKNAENKNKEEEEDGPAFFDSEIKIEKDEDKHKNLKEVHYKTNQKFFEAKIENLQFLEQENGKSKYTTKGSGLFSFELDKNEQGKNIGLFTLREISTKNVKLSGIIIDSTSVEKAKLRAGLDFIFIKNILVKYSKYNSNGLSEQTKITFLRIRVKNEELDNFYNKTNEFFNLVKK